MKKKIVEGKIFIGTAAWAIPKSHQEYFRAEGSHLERYAGTFTAVEINSSFYRDHQKKTYERWAATVPKNFRFSVKLSKVFTHQERLKVKTMSLGETIRSILGLGEKLGCILVQLPPSLSFERQVALDFFRQLREFYSGNLAFEARHLSWASREALQLLAEYQLSWVDADPQVIPADFIKDLPEPTFHYLRLHGSPEIYRSLYESSRLEDYREEIQRRSERGQEVWTIFDNTMVGHAIQNAFELGQFFNTNSFIPSSSYKDIAPFSSRL